MFLNIRSISNELKMARQRILSLPMGFKSSFFLLSAEASDVIRRRQGVANNKQAKTGGNSVDFG